MQVTKLTLRLIAVFAHDLRAAYTIRQLAQNTGTAYANTHKTATKLLNDNILTKETIGHSHNCRINLNNNAALLLLSLVHTDNKKHEWIEKHAKEYNIKLAFERPDGLLIITKDFTRSEAVNARWLTVKEFLRSDFFAKPGRLIHGHTFYPTIIKRWKHG
ncbi:MAG: hypothetical protein OXR66_03705 [Candidatus Woesearchaeota archaeon]|nr:hypothetical protein [Candidatus Woesearchaeota archaeon]